MNRPNIICHMEIGIDVKATKQFFKDADLVDYELVKQ